MKRYIYFSAFAAILAACEYTPEETNYREITPPSQFTGEITLNNVNPEDTISIDKPTEFTCSFSSEHLRIRQASIELDGKEFRSTFNTGNIFTFSLSPLNMDAGNHKTKITFITSRSSNTKSLAELTVAEKYQLEVTWNIKTINPVEYSTAGYRITEKGELELYWDNPAIPDDDIKQYYIGLQYDPHDKTTPPKQKSVIIPEYVFGKKTFKLVTLTNTYSYNNYITVDTPIPQKAYIEDLGNNTLRLYWDKPLAFAYAKYVVDYRIKDTYNFTKIYPSGIDTTVVIPKPAAGKTLECSVSFRNFGGYPEDPLYVYFP